MKICLINNLYDPYFSGGAELSVQYLAETLRKFGIEVMVITSSPNHGVSINNINGVKVFSIGIKNIYWPFFSTQKKIIKPLWHIIDMYNPFYRDLITDIIDREKPKLIHCNNLLGFSVAVWDAVIARKLPLIHTLRDYYLLCPRTIMYKDGRNCTKQCIECRILSYKKLNKSHHIDALIGISEYILEKHLKHGYFANVKIQQVIYNPYIPSTIPERKSSPLMDQINFGYLGRLHPSKGIELILEKIPDSIDLWVAGKGDQSYETYLHRKFQSKNIHFMGFVKPSELLNQIDVLIVPSLWNEPMGRTVVEAYSFGIPVIASNRGGLPELIDEYRAGFTFDPDNPDTLSDILNKFISQPELIIQMRQNCLEKMHEFDPDWIAQKHLEIYESLLN